MDGSTMHSGFKELDHFHWNTFQIIDIGTNIWQTWNVQDRVQEDSFTVRLLVQVWVSSFVYSSKFWWVLSRSQSFHFGFFGKSICQHRECFHFVAHLWYFPVYFLMNKLVLVSWNCFNLAELDEVKLSWILKKGERIRRREPRWKFTLQTWGRWRGQDWGATGGGWWQKTGCTERRWNQVAAFGKLVNHWDCA